jgi:hypothetical protein
MQEVKPAADKGASTLVDKSGKILGKTYFRDPDVNKGFYSKKREGVADVDPKVTIFLTKSLGHGTLCANPWKATSSGRN